MNLTGSGPARRVAWLVGTRRVWGRDLDRVALMLMQRERADAPVLGARLGPEDPVAFVGEQPPRHQLVDPAATGEARVEAQPRVGPLRPAFALPGDDLGHAGVAYLHESLGELAVVTYQSAVHLERIHAASTRRVGTGCDSSDRSARDSRSERDLGLGCGAGQRSGAPGWRPTVGVRQERGRGAAVSATYEFARDALQASGDRRWRGSRFGDPHDWRGAFLGVLSMSAPTLLLVAVLATFSWFWAAVAVLAAPALDRLLVLVRARRVVGRAGAGVRGRYVLARAGLWRHHPYLVVLPADGDEEPWGAVRLADSRGGVPLAGDVMLLGELDPSIGRPGIGAVVVPMLSTGALWPTGRLREVRFDEGRLRVDGLELLTAVRDTAGDAGGVGIAGAAGDAWAPGDAGRAPGAARAQGAAESTPGVWSRGEAVAADIWGAPDVEAVHAAAGWIGVVLALLLPPALRSDRRGLPDLLAGTRVVRASMPDGPGLVASGPALGLGLLLGHLDLSEHLGR